MENKSKRVREILLDSLYKPEELGPDPKTPPEGAILVDGIMHKLGFHPGRLESHREEVREILNDMQAPFHKNTGGGWTFLNLCEDKHGELWTSFQVICGELVALAIGLKMGQYCLPRDMWHVMPGGVPYVMFDTEK